jgi:peptide-methionine (S)-S-oxide reductase
MLSPFRRHLSGLLLLGLLTIVQAGSAAERAVRLPAPAADIPAAAVTGSQTAVFAGGCFWGIEAVFRQTQGVTRAVSGYAGGDAKTANYALVSTGASGHAESVEVTYDPARVSYAQLLNVFFSVAHDPTQINRQGPDVGPQYRSAIFFTNREQQRVAQAYIDQLARAKAFARPIVTQVVPLPGFYPAEAYHQNYVALNPGQPYVVFNDLPKLARLREQFPDLYRSK